MGSVLAFFALPHNLLSSDATVRRLSFIPVAIPLLLLSTGGTPTCIICCMLIIASSSFTAVASWVSTVCKSSTTSQAIGLLSESKWPGWLGFFLGMLIGNCVAANDVNTFTTSVAFLATLVCIGFAWYELGTFDDRQQTKDIEKGAKQKAPVQDAFLERCERLVAIGKLTPRESEVLILLAKGYNADSISRELNIARPTTKTHIQHIYQKLSINSQQALIALVNDQK